jgi:large subunit ribosomal protein L22
MEATASARNLRGSAQKARLVVDLIRGKDVNQALAILRFTKKRAASAIEKCVRSAIANVNEAAEKANISIDPDDLWVKTVFVDRGRTKNMRRVRPAPQGRAYRERRHFCHVTVSLSSDVKPEANATSGKPETKPAKLAESKGRKRGGAAAAPRAKRTAPKVRAEATGETTEKPAAKKASKKRASKSKE